MYKNYFSSKPILAKKCLFNLAVSDRSDGKTFDMKVNTLLDYLTNKYISIIVRRWSTEMEQDFYENFFNEVLEKDEVQNLDTDILNIFKQWKFLYTKKGVKVKTPNMDKWDYICFFMPLTMSGKKKSVFNNYVSRLFKIYFDEYIPLDNRYIKGEMKLLLELYKSVDRDREKVQVLCLGNRITPFIPFLDYFNIELSLISQKLRTYKNDTIAIQVYVSNEHREERKKGKFAKMVEDTDYENYNNGGILTAYNIRIKECKDGDYWLSFMTERGEGSIFIKDRCFYVTNKIRKDGRVLVDKMYNIERETINIKMGLFSKVIKDVYFTDRLYFEDNKAFYIFQDILGKCAI